MRKKAESEYKEATEEHRDTGSCAVQGWLDDMLRSLGKLRGHEDPKGLRRIGKKDCNCGVVRRAEVRWCQTGGGAATSLRCGTRSTTGARARGGARQPAAGAGTIPLCSHNLDARSNQAASCTSRSNDIEPATFARKHSKDAKGPGAPYATAVRQTEERNEQRMRP